MADNHKQEITKCINYLSANASDIADELGCCEADVYDIVDLLVELLGEGDQSNE